MTTLTGKHPLTRPVPGAPTPPADAGRRTSSRSRAGLNAANFFLAEVTGVVMPFVAVSLQGRWRYDAIGLAVALAGLGVFLTQTPAGFLVDRVRQRRALLAGASLFLGVSLRAPRYDAIAAALPSESANAT